jgi:hypothetical protein
MKKIFEIVRIDEMAVVTQSGDRCNDTCDQTEWVEVARLVAFYNSLEECEEWIDNFFTSVYDVQCELRNCESQNGSRQLSTLVAGLIHEFQNKFIYIRETQFFDSYKFEIKTRYIAD